MYVSEEIGDTQGAGGTEQHRSCSSQLSAPLSRPGSEPCPVPPVPPGRPAAARPLQRVLWSWCHRCVCPRLTVSAANCAQEGMGKKSLAPQWGGDRDGWGGSCVPEPSSEEDQRCIE